MRYVFRLQLCHRSEFIAHAEYIVIHFPRNKLKTELFFFTSKGHDVRDNFEQEKNGIFDSASVLFH